MIPVHPQGGAAPAVVTFKSFGERWTSGELSKEHPDHVRHTKSAEDDDALLEKHVYSVLLAEGPWRTVGDVPLPDFSLDHAEAVSRSLDESLEPTTRRLILKKMTRVLSLAAFPARLIKVSPIPRKFVPKPKGAKALQWLYPDEDALLMACEAVPLVRRLYYGVLAREGMRPSEGIDLELPDVDLKRGVLNLDRNTTRDPRAWLLDPSVVRAIEAWLKTRPKTKSAFLFVQDDGSPLKRNTIALKFRDDLRRAGVVRLSLFKSTTERRSVRAHDQRALFTTLSLALGRTEAWIADRTGTAAAMSCAITSAQRGRRRS